MATALAPCESPAMHIRHAPPAGDVLFENATANKDKIKAVDAVRQAETCRQMHVPASLTESTALVLPSAALFCFVIQQ